jgi:S1-C subfamily serine protease
MNYRLRVKSAAALGLLCFAATAVAIPNGSLICTTDITYMKRYCERPSFKSMAVQVEKAFHELVNSSTLSHSDRKHANWQHKVWLQNVVHVCKSNQKCADKALSARKNLYVWANSHGQPPPATAMTSEQVASQTKRAVTSIFIDDIEHGRRKLVGTGVIIGKSKILTNCHVVGDVTVGYFVGLSDSTLIPVAEVVGISPLDLCVLSVPKLSSSDALKIAPFSAFAAGAKVYSFGNPLGRVRSFSQGVMSAIRSSNARAEFTAKFGVVRLIHMQHDSLSSPGSSGGALLDEYGRLIGITSYGLHVNDSKLSFAVPIQYLSYLPTSGIIPGNPYYDEGREE